MGHPSSEVSVMNLSDGLDGWSRGFWWDENNGCRVSFVWHIVKVDEVRNLASEGVEEEN